MVGSIPTRVGCNRCKVKLFLTVLARTANADLHQSSSRLMQERINVQIPVHKEKTMPRQPALPYIIDCGFKLKITSQLFTRIILEGSQTLINARRAECQVTSQTNKETRGHFILTVAEKVAAVRTCALAWSVQHFQS
ncbi:unnamed protein product [Clavelina lepadiformis]|uniref:Uncharacterized protein n=1 Tax=Clavelina lepadiformis TaxID=159417 RepID=A0ABP0FTX1_CLALP